MIIHGNERKTIVKKEFLGGTGELHLTPIMPGAEFEPAGRLFAEGALQPGSSTGKHTHQGDCEVMCFLSGHGLVVDDGVETPVQAGDVNITHHGHTHYLVNNGTEPLRFVTMIYYERGAQD